MVDILLAADIIQSAFLVLCLCANQARYCDLILEGSCELEIILVSSRHLRFVIMTIPGFFATSRYDLNAI